MRRAGWVIFLLAVIPIGLWAQQSASAADSAQSSEKSAPSTPANLPNPQGVGKPQACPAKWDLHPETDGVYKVGGDVKPPKPLFTPEASFSNEARKMIRKKHLKSFEGVSLIGLTVSAEGKPQDLCMMRHADYGLDEQAIQSVEKYRFQPAVKNGAPVAVRITIEVNFKTY